MHVGRRRVRLHEVVTACVQIAPSIAYPQGPAAQRLDPLLLVSCMHLSPSQRLVYPAEPQRNRTDQELQVSDPDLKTPPLPSRRLFESAACYHTTDRGVAPNQLQAIMHSAGKANTTPGSSTPKPSARVPTTVYIVTDTYYPTAADFDVGKGMATIDSVHSTPEAANLHAKKIMFCHKKDREDIDEDKIIEEIRQGLYVGIGIGGERWYARKCEVETKAVDVDEDGSSEGSGDLEDWNMG
jgi:hypothetical protein